MSLLSKSICICSQFRNALFCPSLLCLSLVLSVDLSHLDSVNCSRIQALLATGSYSRLGHVYSPAQRLCQTRMSDPRNTPIKVFLWGCVGLRVKLITNLHATPRSRMWALSFCSSDYEYYCLVEWDAV